MPGTQEDYQSEIAGRPYGYATLNTNISLYATSLTVTTEADWSGEDAAAQPFQVGDTIRLDQRATIDDEGASEYREVSGVSYAGDQLTLTLAAPVESDYQAGAHVASVYMPGDVQAGYEGVAMTNQAGSSLAYDPSGNLAVPQIGSITQVWTVTVTNGAAGAITLEGDTLGQVGLGALGAALQPTNPQGGRYFSLAAEGWSGTAATGDVLTFKTVPACVPLWYVRAVPAGAASIASDPIIVCVEGESA
jgi:hypothetical protein